MHKKCSWKLRQIPCHVKLTETDWNQQPPTVSYFVCELLAYASNNEINIRYFEGVYHRKISILNLKMEFWFQCCNPFPINENHSY